VTPSDIQTAAADRLRRIPAVEELLGRPSLRELEKRVGHPLVRQSIREALETLRRRIAAGEDAAFSP
jgi:selenocysteine synthase-like protein